MEEENVAGYLRRLIEQAKDGEVQWDTLFEALLEAADEIELLQSALDRVRYQTINQNYILGGRG